MYLQKKAVFSRNFRKQIMFLFRKEQIARMCIWMNQWFQESFENFRKNSRFDSVNSMFSRNFSNKQKLKINAINSFVFSRNFCWKKRNRRRYNISTKYLQRREEICKVQSTFSRNFYKKFLQEKKNIQESNGFTKCSTDKKLLLLVE